jgi:hypothetical protein
MCENRFDFFNSYVPLNIDTAVRFFVCVAQTVHYQWEHHRSYSELTSHWRLLTVGVWQRKVADHGCERDEMFSK